MNSTKIVSPTENYSLEIPTAAHEERDERVSSYWTGDQNTILQLSSYTRTEGEQVTADKRLQDRLNREKLSGIKKADIPISSCKDSAAVYATDTQNNKWIYCYAVWPDLAILATISYKSENEIDWAIKSISSIQH